MWNQNYGCGCNSQPVNNCGCVTVQNGPQIGMTLVVTNSWNSPAVGASTELDVPGALSILVGSYIQNPNYGKFLITSYNSATAKITVQNTGFGNLTPGYIIPANTYFNISSDSFNKEGNFSLVFTPYGGLVFTPNGVSSYAQYWAEEDLVHFSLGVDGTLSGTNSIYILINPPILPNGYGGSFSTTLVEGAAFDVGRAAITSPITVGQPAGNPIMMVAKRDRSVFNSGQTLTIEIDGFYKASSYNL